MERGYPDEFVDFVKNRVGSEEYRSLDRYDGRFACAIFVSGVLKSFGLIHHQHDKVQVVIHDLNLIDYIVGEDHFKWVEIDLKDVELGDIIVWEKNKSGHYHIGFYIGDDMAISNSWKERVPVIHDIEFTNDRLKNSKRKIVKVLAFLKEEKCLSN